MSIARATVPRVFLVLVLLMGAETSARRYEPRFFALDRQHLAVAKREAVFDSSFDDQKEEHTVFLLSDEVGRPLLFFADITVSVCIDDVCDPVRVELYWDLAGNYAGFGVVPGFPLLKYDHVPFEPADYAKFHQVLSDKNSLLGERPLTDFLNPGTTPEKRDARGKQPGVDAVSGATVNEIRGAIVGGALYSCHALWHLVHGDVRVQMRRHLRSIFTPDLASQFLHSDSPDYQAFAITEMNEASLEKDLSRVLELFGKSDPSIKACILEKLPGKILKEEKVTRALFLPFAKLGAGTKMTLIENLEKADASAVAILVDQIETMTKAQLRGYLAYISKDPARLSKPIKTRLQRVAAAEQYAYCYVIEEFLRDGSETGR